MNFKKDLKLTISVTRAELKTMFYSPVAWVVILIFMCSVGYSFAEAFSSLLKSQEIGRGIWSVSRGIFGTSLSSITIGIQKYIYLYIPLITMGIMSREYASGSIKLLYSSPIKNSSIILGKYLAMKIYGFILISPLVIFALFSGIVTVNFDYSAVFTSILGLYFLILSYSAIGLFMSTITKYQVVASIGTLAVLGALNNIGSIGGNSETLRAITYWAQISGRANSFLNSYIASEDVFYFIIVISLFLILSIFKLNTEKSIMTWKGKTIKYTLIVATALLLGYITTFPKMKFYYDATYTQTNTLCQESREVVDSLDGGLTITTYVNLLDENMYFSLPNNRHRDKERWEKYIRFKPEIKMDYVYYYDKVSNPNLDNEYPDLTDIEKVEKLCELYDLDKDMFLTPDQIRELVDVDAEKSKYIRVIERESGESVTLRMFNDQNKEPRETEISTALKTLYINRPVVGFAQSYSDRKIENYGGKGYYLFAYDKWFRYSLTNLGFEPKIIDLDTDELKDIDILVLYDFNKKLSDKALSNVRKYIDNGGNMMVMGEYGKNDIMNEAISSLGVEFSKNIIAQDSTSLQPYIIKNIITDNAVAFSSEYEFAKQWGYTVVMPTAVAIDYSKVKDFKVESMIETGNNSWLEKNDTDFIDGKFEYNPKLSEVKKNHSTLVHLSRKIGNKEQRIVVIGDSDCIANEELGTTRIGLDVSNYSVVKSSFRWFSGDEFPIVEERKQPNDDKIKLPDGSGIWVKIIINILLPLSIFISGILIILKRQRK